MPRWIGGWVVRLGSMIQEAKVMFQGLYDKLT